MSHSKLSTIFSRAKPLLANMATCGTLYGLGDISQQTLFKPKGSDYNWTGTKRIVTMAFFGFGTSYYYWYKMLDKKLPGTATKTVLRKLAVDQFLFTPVCLVLFFVGLSIMQKEENIFEEFVQKAPKAYLTGMAFWPPAQIVNFKLCPPHLRPAYVSACAFVWSNILCYIKGAGKEKKSKEEEEADVQEAEGEIEAKQATI